MTHKLSIRVYYEDTDMAGIVYYANYLKYMERARSEAVRDAGIDQREMREDRQIVFAVRRAEIDYLSPARLDDLIEVRTRMARLAGASMVMHQEIWLDHTLLSQGDIKIACMDLDGKPLRIPADIREKLALLPQD